MAGDDAADLDFFALDKIPTDIAFEAHKMAIADLRKSLANEIYFTRWYNSWRIEFSRSIFFRLLLHCAAYRLMHELRCQAAKHSEELGRAQFDSLRLRILKVAALVRQSVRRIHVRLPLAFPFAKIFRALASAVDPPPVPA